MKIQAANTYFSVAKSLVAALCICTSATAWAWTFGTDYASDDCIQENSFVRCAMGFLRVPNVKDLPPGSPKVDPEALVAPYRPDTKNLERGAAVAASIVNASLGATLLFGSMVNTTNYADHLIVSVIMPSSTFGGQKPNELAGQDMLNGMEKLLGFTEKERINRTTFIVKGGEVCGDDGCRISSQLFSDYKLADKLLGKYYDRAPAWMGIDGPIYATNGAIPRLQKLGPAGSQDAVISQNAAIQLSKFLSDYFYIYLPSDKPKAPAVILNGGSVHYAIAPGN